MKTSDYIFKYFTNGVLTHPEEFKYALFNELRSLIEIQTPINGLPNIKVYYNNERVLKMKVEGIKSKGCKIPATFWDEFHKKYLNPFKWNSYPEACAKEQRQREEDAEYERLRKERQSYWERRNAEEFKSFWERLSDAYKIYSELFGFGILFNRVPKDEFNIMNLDPNTATIEEVKSSYRKLALEHHPDRGGNKENFQIITEAKNKCIDYLTSK